jgi:Protein of unknown function, DUF488
MKTIPSRPFTHAPGTLYREGYAGRKGADTIKRLMQQERIQLLDIRLSPRSHWYPAWNRYALSATYGDAYRWEGRLGNLNYRDHSLPIVLADGHEEAIQEAAIQLLEGDSLLLMCACSNPSRCHGTIVAKLIQDAVGELLYPQAEDMPLALYPQAMPPALDITAAQAALERGERVRIAMPPLVTDPTLLQLIQNLQNRVHLTEAIRCDQEGEEV